MVTRYEIRKLFDGPFWIVNELSIDGDKSALVRTRFYRCLSRALFFGLPYGKGSKLRRRPELEKGREVQVWQ